MRIHIKTTPNETLIPFNYQSMLTGAFHKWMGQNMVHDQLSLYSFSWLQGGKANGKGLHFPYGGSFFISAHDIGLIKNLIAGIQQDPIISNGMEVTEIRLQENPCFEDTNTFFVSSPVLVKRLLDGRSIHYTFQETEANKLLTETMQSKLRLAGLQDQGVSVLFDNNYLHPKTKIIRYKKIENKVNQCPVIISGSPEQIAFAWNVGVGNSTGIGFGSLR